LSKSPVIKEADKSSGFSLLKSFLFISIGIIIGLGISFFAQKQENTEQLNTYKAPEKKSIKNLLNPDVLDQHAPYSHLVLNDFSAKLEKKINSMVKQEKIKSASVYFRDFSTDFSFGVNETEIFSPASLMKVPIMIAILKYAEEHPEILSYTKTYEGRREGEYLAKKFTNFPSETFMIEGETYSVNRLLEFMITSSDNEATILLLDVLDGEDPKFLDKVQLDLGLTLPKNLKHNDNFLSGKKYSSFFRTLYNASYLNNEMSSKALNYLSKTGYGFGIKQSVPQNIVLCHKFGYQIENSNNFQLHHFAIVYHPRKTYLIGVMTKGNYVEELKKAITDLAQICYSEVDQQTQNELQGLPKDLE